MSETGNSSYEVGQSVTRNGITATVTYVEHTVPARCPACRKLYTCKRYDLGATMAWGCQLTPAALAHGEPIEFQVGRVVITLTCVRVNAAYAVTVYQGTLRVDEQCGSYPTEAMARAIARGYAQMYVLEALAPIAA